MTSPCWGISTHAEVTGTESKSASRQWKRKFQKLLILLSFTFTAVSFVLQIAASLEGAYKSSTMEDGTSYSRQLQQSSDISLWRQSPQHQSEQLEPQNSRAPTSVGGNKIVRTTNQALHADSVGDEVMFEQQRYTSRYSLLQKLEKQQRLPKWVTDYYRWHQEQLRTINPDNWDQHKYMVFRCLNRDKRECRGASDRLQPIPLILRAAARKEQPRLLFIKWEQPFALEEFLVPNLMNWTLPSWLDERLETLRTEIAPQVWTRRTFLQPREQENQTLIETGGIAIYGPDHGAITYNKYTRRGDRKSGTFEKIYHNLWESLFQPSPPVRQRINSVMKSNDLIPNQYSAMHMRMHFFDNEEKVAGLVHNATSCGIRSVAMMKATKKRNGYVIPAPPLYVASDSRVAIQQAMSMGNEYGVRVVARDNFNASNPLHLDWGYVLGHHKESRGRTYGPEAYYDIFVDIYLLGMARCNVYGRGGYGKWGNMMSYNSRCSLSYFDYDKHQYQWPQRCFNITKKKATVAKKVL